MFDWLNQLRQARAPAKKTAAHLALGALGERLAVEYLLKHKQYRLVATNFVTPIGHSSTGRQITGEIDIIAYDESARPFTLAFIEVKTRTSAEMAAPQAAVDLRKQRQIVRAARVYRRVLRLNEEPFRYDVVTVIAAPGQTPQIELLRGYFSEQIFQRSNWYRREF